MKVAVIGSGGQLGQDLCGVIPEESLIPLTHADIEVSDPSSVNRAFELHRPDIVISTAAFHRIDECEKEPDRAFLVNAIGARNVAVAAERHGAKLAFLSTDYVFGGDRGRTTPYTEYDEPAPVNLYGQSKVAGERSIIHLCRRHFVIRVSGLFGVAGSSGKGPNFIQRVMRNAREGRELRIVDDQRFRPTAAADLAPKIWEFVQTELYGIVHITNHGVCSWYELAREALRQAGIEAEITPITSDEWKQRAERPAYSALDNYNLRLLGMDDMRPWQEALADYIKAEAAYETVGGRWRQ